jgi:hypothetical protein
VDVPERDIQFVRVFGDKAVISDASLHLGKNAEGKLTAYGSGVVSCQVYADGEVQERLLGFVDDTEMEFEI